MVIGGYFFHRLIKGKENGQTRYMFANVQKGTITVSVSGSGQIAALDALDIRSKVSGDIAAIYVKKDQEVRSGQILMKFDSKEKERIVRDAQIVLDDVKIALQKAEEDYIKLIEGSENSLDSSNKDILSVLSGAFSDFNSTLPSLETTFRDKNYSGKESDIDCYIYLVKTIRGYRGVMNALPYWTIGAQDKFISLKSRFENIKSEYWTLNQRSSRDLIKSVLNQTHDFANELLDFTRQASNVLLEYQKVIEEEGFAPPISRAITNNQASQLKSFSSIVSSIAGSLQKEKDAVVNLEENIPKKIKDAESAVKTAKNNVIKKEEALSDAKQELFYFSAYAPFGGLIADLKVKAGDSVSSNTVLANIITKQKVAQISLNEIDAAKVKIGQRAILDFDSFPDLTITGKVMEVDLIGTVVQGVVSYGAKIAFDTDLETIKPGMSVTADIIVDVKSNILALPNSALKAQTGIYYVELVEIPEEKKQEYLNSRTGVILSGDLKRLSVELGISNESLTEIISGLNEGDIIISSIINSTANQTSQNQRTQQLQIPGMGGQIRMR